MNTLHEITSHRKWAFTYQMVKWWQQPTLETGEKLRAAFDQAGALDDRGNLTAEATQAWFAYLDQLERDREQVAVRHAGYANTDDALKSIGQLAKVNPPAAVEKYRQVFG